MQRYNDEFFISKLEKEGVMSAYKFSRKFGLHQNTVQNRLNDLANRGLINRISVTPEKFGPKESKNKTTKHSVKEHEISLSISSGSSSIIQDEILDTINEYKELTISEIIAILGYSRNTIAKYVKDLVDKKVLVLTKKGSSSYVSFPLKSKRKDLPSHNETIKEQVATLTIESLLSIIKNALSDLESQMTVLYSQNEALKNIIENNRNPQVIDEETIREDERNNVFLSISNVMKISPDIVADWYKAGKKK